MAYNIVLPGTYGEFNESLNDLFVTGAQASCLVVYVKSGGSVAVAHILSANLNQEKDVVANLGDFYDLLMNSTEAKAFFAPRFGSTTQEALKNLASCTGREIEEVGGVVRGRSGSFGATTRSKRSGSLSGIVASNAQVPLFPVRGGVSGEPVKKITKMNITYSDYTIDKDGNVNSIASSSTWKQIVDDAIRVCEEGEKRKIAEYSGSGGVVTLSKNTKISSALYMT